MNLSLSYLFFAFVVAVQGSPAPSEKIPPTESLQEAPVPQGLQFLRGVNAGMNAGVNARLSLDTLFPPIISLPIQLDSQFLEFLGLDVPVIYALATTDTTLQALEFQIISILSTLLPTPFPTNVSPQNMVLRSNDFVVTTDLELQDVILSDQLNIEAGKATGSLTLNLLR